MQILETGHNMTRMKNVNYGGGVYFDEYYTFPTGVISVNPGRRGLLTCN